MAGSLNHNELVLFWTISFFSSYAIAVFLRWIVEKTNDIKAQATRRC